MTEMIAEPDYYASRYSFNPARQKVWRVICAYLKRFLPSDGKVLELGAGYCAFINQFDAYEKHAIDLNPVFEQYADADVITYTRTCSDLSNFGDSYFDLVLASNLFEHLTSHILDETLAEIRRVLAHTGSLVIIQPNFHDCYRTYFDDYTHLRIFTHVSMCDLLAARGFSVERVESRFLPYSMQSRLPTWPWLVRLYLASPLRPFAGQMLIIAHPKH